MIKIEIDQNVVANYLNSRTSDQQLKCGQMLATLKYLLEYQEKINKRLEKLEGGDKNGSETTVY